LGALSGLKVAVAGGGGFIGTHLCNALAEAGAAVAALGRSRLDASAFDSRVAWASFELRDSLRLRELIPATSSIFSPAPRRRRLPKRIRRARLRITSRHRSAWLSIRNSAMRPWRRFPISPWRTALR
jgi:NAD dependent epimerase/dehydratase family enzyme